MPRWAHLDIPEIDFQSISYYAAPKTKSAPGSMDEVDPELRRTFDKLGIPLEEQMRLSGVAVDAVMDSVSVKTTYRDKLAELGVIFCSISEEDHLSRQARGTWRDILFHIGSGEGLSRLGAQISWLGGFLP